MAIDSCKVDAVNEDRLSTLVPQILNTVPPATAASIKRSLRELATHIIEALDSITSAENSHTSKAPESRSLSIADRDVASAVSIIVESGAKFGDFQVKVTRPSFLAETALVSIVSAFEVFCTEIISEIYKYQPRAIPGNPAVPLDLLLEHPSARKAISALAEDRARDATRGSVESWIRTLSPHCGLNLPKRSKDWQEPWKQICLAGLTRNCIVHAGSSVDGELRTKLNSLGSHTKIEDGRIIFTASDAKEAALAVLQAASRVLLGVSQKHCAKDESAQSEDWMMRFLAEQRIDLCESGSPEIARAITCSLNTDDKVPSEYHEGRILTWISDCLLDAAARTDFKEIQANPSDAGSPMIYLQLASITASTEELVHIARNLIQKREISYIDLLANIKLSLFRSRVSKTTLDELRPEWLTIPEHDEN